LTEATSPKPERVHQDWVTSFDRDLIRAAKNKTPISFETIEDEQEVRGAIVIQVDKEFIKIRHDGIEVWFNKSHMCKVMITHEN
jgi:hypothetical protein